MNEKDLPPVLTRADFDDDEEYAAYLEVEAGHYQPAPLDDERREWWRKVAEYTINPKRRRITISVPEPDLMRLKAEAMREGMPYQTLINSILHKWLDRRR